MPKTNPKTGPEDEVRRNPVLALPMSRSTRFYVEKAKRTTDCRICRLPIKVRRKRVRIEMNRLNPHQLKNGGMIFKTIWFTHVGCMKSLFGGEAGSRRFDCFACGRPAEVAGKTTRHRIAGHAWSIVSFSSSYGRLCEDCAASPRWAECGSCRSYAATRHVEPMSCDDGVTVTPMCRHCRRAQPEYISMVKVNRDRVTTERKFKSLSNRLKKNGPWLTRS